MTKYIGSQKIFSQILAVKTIRGGFAKDGKRDKDMLFMITTDLKLYILGFNNESCQFENLSTFQVDIGSAGSKQMNEVVYLTYDSTKHIMVLLFKDNYVLTVELTSENP